MKEERKEVIGIIKELRGLTAKQLLELQLKPTLKHLKKETRRLYQKIMREPKGFELPKGWSVYIRNFGGSEKANFYGLYTIPTDVKFSGSISIKKPFYIPVEIDEKTKGIYLFKMGCLTPVGKKKLTKCISSHKPISKRKLDEIFDKQRVKNLHRVLSTEADNKNIENIFKDILMNATSNKIQLIKIMIECYLLVLQNWRALEEKGIKQYIQEIESNPQLKIGLKYFPVTTDWARRLWGQSDYSIAKFMSILIRDLVNELLATKYFKTCLGCGGLFWTRIVRKYCSNECAATVRDWIKQSKRAEKA